MRWMHSWLICSSRPFHLTVGDADFLALQIGLVEYDINQKVYVVLHPSRMNVYRKDTGRLIKYAKVKHHVGDDEE